MGKLPRLIAFCIKSLPARLILIILIFLFIPAVILIKVNFSATEESIREQTASLIIGQLNQIGNQIENINLNIIQLSNLVCSDRTILQELSEAARKNPKTGVDADKDFYQIKDFYQYTPKDYLKVTKINKQLDTAKNNLLFNYNADVMIIEADGILYNSFENNEFFLDKYQFMKDWVRQGGLDTLKEQRETLIWTMPFQYQTPKLEQERYLSTCRIIKNDYSPGMLGVLMINFNLRYLEELAAVNHTGTTYLLDKDFKPIFGSQNRKLPEVLTANTLKPYLTRKSKGFFLHSTGRKQLLISFYSGKRGVVLINVLPVSELATGITSLKRTVYTVTLLIALLCFFISAGLILYTTKPLKELLNKIKQIKIGPYRIDTQPEVQTDDIRLLVQGFDQMVKRMEELVQTVIEEQKREEELKYEALRAEITPHFLFNTLNTVKWLAMISGATNVTKIITDLGRLLEVSTNKGPEEISLQDEIELVEAYLSLQNFRYNNRFALTAAIGSELLGLKVIKMILQPVVENSIIHGFKDPKLQGRIEITAALNQAVLEVQVSDNGSGMTREQTAAVVREGPAVEPGRKFSGIGLKNIDERLKLKYGAAYGIAIRSETGQGTTVTIRLPVIS